MFNASKASREPASCLNDQRVLSEPSFSFASLSS